MRPPDPFPLDRLPGLQPWPSWPPPRFQAGGHHAFQAGPVRIQALTLPADPGPWLAALEPHASDARRQRAARFHRPDDALRCLAAEALLAQALQAHGLDLRQLTLRTGPHGKPRLAGQPRLHFNLSHAGPWLLCALHDRPVGIDVEEERLQAPLPAELIMTPEELRHHGTLAPGAARAHFFRLWTLKESLLKALGTGLSVDPRTIGLAFSPAGVTPLQGRLRLAAWPLAELPMPEGVRAALCYCGLP